MVISIASIASKKTMLVYHFSGSPQAHPALPSRFVSWKLMSSKWSSSEPLARNNSSSKAWGEQRTGAVGFNNFLAPPGENQFITIFLGRFWKIYGIKFMKWFGIYSIWLVVSTPLTNMSSSVGMIIPNIWKVIIQPCSSHHQPAIYCERTFRNHVTTAAPPQLPIDKKKLLGDHAILVEINLPGCVMVNSMGVLLWALRHDKFVWPVW